MERRAGQCQARWAEVIPERRCSEEILSHFLKRNLLVEIIESHLRRQSGSEILYFTPAGNWSVERVNIMRFERIGTRREVVITPVVERTKG